MEAKRMFGFDGPPVKIHAGGFVFKSGIAREVPAKMLTVERLANFAKYGIREILPKPAEVATPQESAHEGEDDSPRRGRRRRPLIDAEE